MVGGVGERYLASGRQYGNALLGVRHQEEEGGVGGDFTSVTQTIATVLYCVAKPIRI